MILFYRVLTHLIYPFLFIIVFLRVFLKKEDPKRYKEKILISHFNVKRNYDQKLIWFHAASIGELKSILPILKEINKKHPRLKQVLVKGSLCPVCPSCLFPLPPSLPFGLFVVRSPLLWCGPGLVSGAGSSGASLLFG